MAFIGIGAEQLRVRLDGGLGVGRAHLGTQPFARVEPALDLAGLLDPLDASVLPAFESAAFDGLAI